MQLCVGDKSFFEVTLTCSSSEINMSFHFMQTFKMAVKSGRKVFGKNSPVDSAASLWVKQFIKIALALSISKINMLLCFTQKFKMATKNNFGKNLPVESADLLGSKVLLKSL